jgi:hypothetical protein
MTYSALTLEPDFNDPDLDWIALPPTAYWSTTENLIAEKELALAVDSLQGINDTLRLPDSFLQQRRQRFLDEKQQKIDFEEAEEQAHVIFDQMTVTHRLTLVTGPPGAAKTTVAAYWVRAARAHNPYLPIILITTEKEALNRLNEKMVEALADVSLTMEEALQATKSWPKHACVMIDEAGLIDTPAMANLLSQAVNASSSRVILIGDDKQLLPKTGYGQPFRWMREKNKAQTITLSQSFRQRNALLRKVVLDLYQNQAAQALEKLMPSFVLPETLAQTVKQHIQRSPPEKTLVVVHGNQDMLDRLRTECSGFRILSLTEAQGLAFDYTVFVIAQKLDGAAMLVGCSRQRYSLDVIVDESVYPRREALIEDAGTWPKHLMALDLLSDADLLSVDSDI